MLDARPECLPATGTNDSIAGQGHLESAVFVFLSKRNSLNSAAFKLWCLTRPTGERMIPVHRSTISALAGRMMPLSDWSWNPSYARHATRLRIVALAVAMSAAALFLLRW